MRCLWNQVKLLCVSKTLTHNNETHRKDGDDNYVHIYLHLLMKQPLINYTRYNADVVPTLFI